MNNPTYMSEADVVKELAKYNSLKRETYNFMIHWQVISEYFQTIKADFTMNFIPGMFLNRDLYDSTGPKCVNIMAGTLLGMLWPEGERNFDLDLADNIPDTVENRDFINWQGRQLLCEMNHQEAGLALALNSGMRDGVCFGTYGVGVFSAPQHEAYECFFLFQPWDTKRIVIDEGPNGLVNRAYYEAERSVQSLVLEYGIENVSQESRDKYNKGDLDQKVIVLHGITPRYERDPDGASVFDMPVRSFEIELSGGGINVGGGIGFGTGAPNNGKLLKESGFEQMRVFVNRFYKNLREKYGRSPAMDALPDVLELNALREAEIVATEKLLDPPLAVLDDGRLGADTIDTSAGAINVFNISGRINSNQPPIMQLQTIQDIKSTKDRIEELKQSVSDHFMIDHLLDFNNETEMTLGEVNIREKFRARLLSGLFSRQIVEVFSPMIKCCYNMMLQASKLGVMPGSRGHYDMLVAGVPNKLIPRDIAAAILRGENVYEIKYLTPAMRMVQSELMGGILNTWKMMNDVAQAQPEIYDNVDEDMSIQLVGQYAGAPREIFRSKEARDKIRQVRGQQQQEQQQFQQKIEMMKAAGHLGKLMPQQGAPGVQAAPEMAQPLAL
jgi:hypothetical protein